MGYTYLTPPDRSPVSPRTASRAARSRCQPYDRARSLTPTSGPRPSRSSESILSSHSSNKTRPQLALKSHYSYNPASYAQQYYNTPDPSPLPVRHTHHKASFPVPPTIDEQFPTHYRPALPPTPPRTTSRASVDYEGITPIPPCSIDSPYARRAFIEQLYDTLMSIYYHPNSPSSAPKVYMPVPGSLPVDPTTLHWFTTELVRRASVSGGVLQLALSYMVRARSAALRACEAQVPAPISPPPSPTYPSHMDSRRSRSPCGLMAVPGPELADPRQMLLGALVLAQKFLIDAAYTSATWGKLSGLSASNVGAVERALGTALDWRLWDQSL